MLGDGCVRQWDKWRTRGPHEGRRGPEETADRAEEGLRSLTARLRSPAARAASPPGRRHTEALHRGAPVPVQVNGKLRNVVKSPSGADKAELEKLARADQRIAELLADKQVVKVVVVPGRLVNFVVK